MIYISLDQATESITRLRGLIDNRLMGILGILYTIGSSIIDNQTYLIEDSTLSNWYDDALFLDAEAAPIRTDKCHYVKFACTWKSFIAHKLIKGEPNIFDLILVTSLSKGWDKKPSPHQLIQEFSDKYHLDISFLRDNFNTEEINISWSQSPINRKELKRALGLSSFTISYDRGNPSVVARAGQLSRAPFFQTLYAGIECLECLIISNTDIEKLYPSRSVPAPAASPLPLQAIYYGTPGSGKSHQLRQQTEGKGRAFRTTFHPESDYASFVGCYKPVMAIDEAGQEHIRYAFVPQVFTEAYVYAYQHPDERTFLIIEEINRGNCAQIFGDLFQLLDRNTAGYSEYPIRANYELCQYLQSVLPTGTYSCQHEAGELSLPPNLHLLATMNTSDQSLYPMDSAFKRRWAWIYVPIDYSHLGASGAYTIQLGEERYAWVDFLRTINQRILQITLSEDKQLGNYFIRHDIDEDEFRSKVLFYLWQEVCREEYGTDNNLLRSQLSPENEPTELSYGDLFAANSTALLQGLMRYWELQPLSE